jgi:polyferredoxin
MLTCPHCGKEFVQQAEPKAKWYFTNKWIVIALLSVGPFALPMIWFNPNYRPATKWLLTILTLTATAILIVLFVILVGILIEQFRNITQMLSV